MGTKPSIVFFGSGPVAAKSLELLNAYCDIEAVITKPQPPHHKEPFPVLQAAEKLGTKVFTPFGKTELSELFKTRPVTSKLGIVIDYGFIINQDVINYFPLGIINSHFSLLPELRGADPISFAILSGQKRTGASLMRITAGMDEGPILSFGVHEDIDKLTTPQLTESLIYLSDGLLKQSLPRYVTGNSKLIDQLDIHKELDWYPSEPTYSRKLTKEDGMLDLSKPAEQLEREIRAFIEWPRSRIVLDKIEIIVTKAHISSENHNKNGIVWLDNPTKPKQFGLITSNGILVIDSLKPAGKPEMTAEAFLNGYRHLLS
jgi:methionyl-tRNA formyltransferase